MAMGQIVVVLHARDFGDYLRLGYLSGGDIAYLDVAVQPLAPQVGQNRHLLGDGPFCGAVDRPHRTVVDDVEHVQAQIAKVVVDTVSQFLGRDGRLPRFVGRASGPELCDDHQPRWIRVQRLPDDLVGDVRAVEVSRVDMVHASRYGFADDSDGAIGIPGRAPYAGASQLHRTVAYPFNRQ